LNKPKVIVRPGVTVTLGFFDFLLTSLGVKHMKKLTCKAMGTECHFEATGQTAEEVKNKMVEHAKTDHAEMFNKMSDSEKEGMMKMMDEKMEDA